MRSIQVTIQLQKQDNNKQFNDINNDDSVCSAIEGTGTAASSCQVQENNDNDIRAIKSDLENILNKLNMNI